MLTLVSVLAEPLANAWELTAGLGELPVEACDPLRTAVPSLLVSSISKDPVRCKAGVR